MKRQKPPIHPGIILREDVIKEHGLTVTDAARMLGVTRAALSYVVNGKAAISAEMAYRIEAVFGGAADLWTRLQMKYHKEIMDTLNAKSCLVGCEVLIVPSQQSRKIHYTSTIRFF